ncbi:MAG: exosortase system-associated protein, TIGR04073 family [Candidatus Omnitrophica bacterium]|nr:exosortase system-associated protein, TIGR04073 family [Candidatus Omnitrophota bacterium]
MKRRCRAFLVAGSLIVLGLPAGAWAQDPIHKMGRGVVNVLTGWLEIPKQIHLGAQESNPIIGLGQGVLRGVSLTALRTGLGLYEAVTFPIPYPQQFASPYEPMELSDYSWD